MEIATTNFKEIAECQFCTTKTKLAKKGERLGKICLSCMIVYTDIGELEK
jgi:hypothetical protein